MIVETITRTGGHLASNLGVVELTLALHRAFDSPKDRLVWDTSNQCYTHKLVTGRRDRFPTIRTPGGLSASPSRRRAARHARGGPRGDRPVLRASACRSRSRTRQDEPYVVVDRRRRRPDLRAELRGPEQHRPRQAEAARRDLQRQRLVDLGEHRLAGALAQPIRAPPEVPEAHEAGQKLLSKLPHGEEAWKLARKVKSSVEGLFLPNLIWDEMGFHYIGPMDGHNFEELEEALEARQGSLRGRHAGRHPRADAQGPRLHAGRGQSLQVPPAGHPDRRAGPGARYTYSQVFARTLITPHGEGREDRRDQRRDARGDRPDRGQEALSRTASTTSASPRSTPSSWRPAWRRRAGGRSSRSTRRSCSAPTTS